jgi:hypothetical protein
LAVDCKSGAVLWPPHAAEAAGEGSAEGGPMRFVAQVFNDGEVTFDHNEIVDGTG